jgi:hypothetical protein
LLLKHLFEHRASMSNKIPPFLAVIEEAHNFIPSPIHAGGLRYHGMASIVCHLYKLGLIEAKAVPQVATFEAGVTFARTEGIITGPEPCHSHHCEVCPKNCLCPGATAVTIGSGIRPRADRPRTGAEIRSASRSTHVRRILSPAFCSSVPVIGSPVTMVYRYAISS